MKELNLPEADLRIRKQKGRTEIFDIIRRRFVRLSPEEWVRQHFIHYLISQVQVPASLIAVETAIQYHRLSKRCDIVVYNKTGKPVLVVECKAPEVEITQAVFDQVAMYNMTLQVNYLIVTNGLKHFVCYIDHEKRSYAFLKEIPGYSEIAK